MIIERIIGWQGPGVYKIIEGEKKGELIQLERKPKTDDHIQVYPWFNKGVTYRTLAEAALKKEER